jgi:hypothetical protein
VTARLLPTDGCPSCVTADPVHPFAVVAGRDIAADYQCPACGHRWRTNWHISALDLPCPGCPACTGEGRVA